MSLIAKYLQNKFSNLLLTNGEITFLILTLGDKIREYEKVYKKSRQKERRERNKQLIVNCENLKKKLERMLC